MKISRFLIGIIFLAGPNISIFDLVPDIIGYLLIYSSITKVALLAPEVADGKDALRPLINTSLCKIVCAFLLLFLSSSNRGSFDKGWHLTFTFAFAIVETIFSMRAFNSILNGLDSAWVRFGSGSGEAHFNNTLALTRLFIVAKNGLCLLAELPFLMESSTNMPYNMVIATANSTRSLLYILNLIGCTVLGVIWYVYFKKYLKRFKFASFQNNAQKEYLSRLADNPSLLLRNKIASIFSLIKVGIIFTFSFSVWNVDIIPSFIFGVLGFASYTIMNKQIKDCGGIRVMKVNTGAKASSLLFTLSSLSKTVLTIIFFLIYASPEESLSFSDVLSVVIEIEPLALSLYICLCVFAVLEGITLVYYTGQLSKIMLEIAKVYTPSKYEHAQYASKNDEVLLTIRTAFNYAKLSSLLFAACIILQQLLILNVSIMWFVTMLASLLFLSLLGRATDILAKECKSRFLYE